MMTIRLIALFLILVSTTGFADDSEKPESLPAAKPCVFFSDLETGEPTGEPANAPCDLHTTLINPGDPVDPELRKQYGKVFEAQPENIQNESNAQ